MAFFPVSLENLIDKFASLPGIGKKSAQRLAFHVLTLFQMPFVRQGIHFDFVRSAKILQRRASAEYVPVKDVTILPSALCQSPGMY